VRGLHAPLRAKAKTAKFPAVKSLGSFNLKAIPSPNKMMVLELARCNWPIGDASCLRNLAKTCKMFWQPCLPAKQKWPESENKAADI